MKKILSILLVFSVAIATAQTEQEKLTTVMKEFHQSMVKQNIVSINQQTDKELSYGHSNGWLQTKTDLIKDFETGLISYQSFKEDSILIGISGNVAYVRFIADINSTLRGTASTNHIRVMEVWVKKGKRWVLFARQAARIVV